MSFKHDRFVNDIKEAIWFGVVAGIGLLVLVILYQSSGIIGLHAGTGQASNPGIFWLVVILCLSLCALVPYLLNESKPRDFKIIAILLTSVAPAVLIGFILFALWNAPAPG